MTSRDHDVTGAGQQLTDNRSVGRLVPVREGAGGLGRGRAGLAVGEPAASSGGPYEPTCKRNTQRTQGHGLALDAQECFLQEWPSTKKIDRSMGPICMYSKRLLLY